MSINKKNLDYKKEPKKILKNTFYTFLTNISLYFYAIITSYLLARQISQEIWGFLILATSYITIIAIILNFIPPGLNASLLYFIPRYRALKEMNILKSFLIKIFLLKVIVVIAVFIIFNIFIIFFSNIFTINLENYISLLYILSPLIIIQCLNSFFFAFKIGFNLFKLTLIIRLINYFTNILGYLLYFIFFEVILIEVIALINLFSTFLPFLLDCFIFGFKLSKIETTEEKKLGFKEAIKKVLNYGSYASTQAIAGQLWDPIQIQTIGLFQGSQWVTGYNIGSHYSGIPKIFSTSLNVPLGISFTNLYSKSDFEQVAKIVKHIISYVLFIISIVVGVLFFFTDFFLFFIYGDAYLIFSSTIKLLVLSIGYGNITSLFSILLHVTYKVKLVPLFVLILYLIRIPLFLIGLIFYGINGSVIGIIIGNVILLFLSSFSIRRVFKIKLNILKISLQYLFFYISLGLALLFGELILNSINYSILKALNLLYFKYFPLLSLLTFLLIFLVLNLAFKIFTKKDAEYLELLFTKETFSHKFIRKLSKILKYVLR